MTAEFPQPTPPAEYDSAWQPTIVSTYAQPVETPRCVVAQSDSFRCSVELDKIGEALAKAQLGFETATLDAKNPHLKNKFASYKSVLDSCRTALNQCGVFLMHGCSAPKDDVRVITTRLLHSSGQWIETSVELEYSVPKGLNKAQAQGSTLTYGKRYGLALICAIATGDDDDAAGAGPGRDDAFDAKVKAALKAGTVGMDQLKAIAQKHGVRKIWTSPGAKAEVNKLIDDSAEDLEDMGLDHSASA